MNIYIYLYHTQMSGNGRAGGIQFFPPSPLPVPVSSQPETTKGFTAHTGLYRHTGINMHVDYVSGFGFMRFKA